MELFPSSKIFLEIGSLTITWYAILSMSGFLAAYVLSMRTFQKMGYNKEKLEDYMYMMLPIAYVGARLWYCAFEWQRYVNDPISILYVWEGGLAFHGGVIAAAIFTYYYCRKNNMNLLRFADAALPNVLIGQMIGRWGNFVNQEAFGPIVSEEMFRFIPDFIKDGMFIDGAYRMPTFLFEGIGNLIGWILIRFAYNRYGRKKRGDLAYAYAIWYGMVRFIIEGFRTDALMIGPLRTAQLVSLGFILIGLLGIFGVYDKVFANTSIFRKEKPVLVFDVDGTLLNTIPLITDSFKHVIQTYDPTRVISETELKELAGPALSKSLSDLFPNEDLDELIECYRSFNRAHHDEYVSAYPYTKEMLAKCKEEGYILAVVSNKIESLVKHGLEICGILEYFDAIICAEQMSAPKPDPDGILKACQEVSRTHDFCIYFGDAPSDIQAAKSISVYSVGVVFDEERRAILEKEKPCTILNDWRELESLLKEDKEWSDNSTLLL